MAWDEIFADFLVEVCRRLRPCFRFSIRFCFFGLLAFVLASVMYTTMAFTRQKVSYVNIQGSVHIRDEQNLIQEQPLDLDDDDDDSKVDESTCLTDAEYVAQHSSSSELAESHKPPKTPVVPKLPWKFWNWCYRHPINIEFIIAQEDFCSNSTEAPILRIMLSSFETVVDRGKIREAYLNANLAEKGVRTVFIIGRSDNVTQQEGLIEESAKHGDVVQVNVTDDNFSASLKVLAAMHWMTTYCPQAKYFYRAALSHEDKFLASVLKTVEERKKEPPPVGLIYCGRKSDILPPVLREGPEAPSYAKPHWLVSYNDYPEHFFPQYCMIAYMIPEDVVKRLLVMSTWTRPFHLDGAYITGILPTMMGNAARVLLK